MKILFRQERVESIPIEEDFSEIPLMETIEKTRLALDMAYAGFDNATDVDLIDGYIYEINSLLKKYSYLTALAVKENGNEELGPEPSVHTLVREVLS